MYCRNCGKELLENDNFCPVCGTKVEKKAQESENREIVFDPNTVPETKENFDFKWDLGDFNRQQRKTEDAANFDWGDLLGVKKERTVNDRISEASRLPGKNYEPISDFVFDPSGVAQPAERKAADKFGSREDDFYTFSKKNEEFQELLNKEHERVKKAKEERELRLEELNLDDINKEIVLDEDPEEQEQPQAEETGLARRRRKRREAGQTEYIPVAPKTEIPLKVDEDDISGQWPPEPAQEAEAEKQPEEQAPENKQEQTVESAPETEQPVNQIEEMARARELLFNSDNLEQQLEEDAAQSQSPEKVRVATQQISRDQFAEFLKKAEEQFGIDALDKKIEEDYKNVEEIVEELPDAEDVSEESAEVQAAKTNEPESAPEEVKETAEQELPKVQDISEEEQPEEPQEQQETAAAEDAPKKKRSRRVKEQTGEFHLGDFKDDNFWSSEPEETDEYEEDEPVSAGGRAATVVIVILAVILAFMIAMMIIRFQFPESAAAQFIEPKLTVIENWIRGIFS